MAAEFRTLLLEGTRLLQRGKAKEAEALLKRAHEMDPDNYDAALNLSGSYILMGSFKKAVPILEELIKREDVSAAVYTNLGAAYLGNPVLARPDDQDNAISALKRALELDSSALNCAYNIGLIYRDRKEFDQAIFWFSEELKINPDDTNAENQIKKIQLIQNRN